MKVCSNDPGHMTKMTTMPIYGINPLNILFSFTQKSLGCLMEYSLECFRSLNQNGRNPLKTKYVTL